MKRHWFWPFCLILASLGPDLVRAAAPESSADRLKKLLKLPSVSLEAGFSLNSEDGLSLAPSKAEDPKEISVIQKQLKGDSSDAERYCRLGELHRRNNDVKRAEECYKRSAELFRRQVATRPDDPEVLARFGRALWAAGQDDEAESMLRRAVQIDPRCAVCWQDLGHYFESAAKRALVNSGESGAKRLNAEALLAGVAKTKPRGSQVAESRKFAAEATACFDKAIEVSTNSSDAYLQRALHKSFDGYLQNVFTLIRGDITDPGEVMRGMFDVACLPDFQKAAELSTKDFRTLSMAAFFEAFACGAQSLKRLHGAPCSWEQLPDRSQQSIRLIMTRLDNLGQDPDSHIAAGALETLAILQGYVVGDRVGAEKSARRAVALDPGREQSWDMLIGFLLKPESFEELRAACEARVQQKETARNRILLAKAHERLNQLDRAEANVLLALKLDPNDFTANLAQAALLMKRRSDSGGLGGAARYLGKAEQILKKENKENDLRYVQLRLTSSIYYALRGDTDKARELLNDVLESDKNNQEAREILSALSS